MNKSYTGFKFIGTMTLLKRLSNNPKPQNIKGTNMNIKDLIRTQCSSMNASDYAFDLPSNFNSLSDDACSIVSSKRNVTKYSAKPYTFCGEVNKDFYSHYIPFIQDFRTNP